MGSNPDYLLKSFLLYLGGFLKNVLNHYPNVENSKMVRIRIWHIFLRNYRGEKFSEIKPPLKLPPQFQKYMQKNT